MLYPKRLLLIVDPQIDFITGSLPVPGAQPAMEALAGYVASHASDYALICVTCDRHPLRHSSFRTFGGQWPSHCIESSVGAAVWPSLMGALVQNSENVRLLYKGENENKDEYSIFQSASGSVDIDRYLRDYDIQEIDICGLAGDICVANTLRDTRCMYPAIRLRILTQFTASLDGGSVITALAQ